jgi:anti-sigma factor RsiW
MTNQHDTDERSEIEDLLPWHAAGTLSRRETEQVEAALARDPELARRLELVREELSATIHLNETLGAPSPLAAEKLFAAIDAERKPMRSLGLSARITEFFASLTPRQLAFSAAAGAIAIVLQAGLIGAIVIGERSQTQGTYQTASAEKRTEAESYAIVRFAPNASARDIASLLDANRISIVEGPRPGGLYRVRIAALPQDTVQYRDLTKKPSRAELRDQTIAKLRAASNIVSFVMPVQ